MSNNTHDVTQVPPHGLIAVALAVHGMATGKGNLAAVQLLLTLDPDLPEAVSKGLIELHHRPYEGAQMLHAQVTDWDFHYAGLLRKPEASRRVLAIAKSLATGMPVDLSRCHELTPALAVAVAEAVLTATGMAEHFTVTARETCPEWLRTSVNARTSGTAAGQGGS